MFKLIGFEMKKIFRNAWFWFWLIVLIGINIFLFHQNWKECYLGDSHKKVYQSISGKMTVQKTKWAIQRHADLEEKIKSGNFSTEKSKNTISGYEFFDYNEFEVMLEQLEYNYDYKEYAKSIVDGHSFDTAIGKDIIKKYNNRRIMYFYDLMAAQFLLDWDYAALFSLLFMMLWGTMIFQQEKKWKMESIVHATKKGNQKVFWAKMITLFLICMGTVFLFLVMEMLELKSDGLSKGVLKLPLYAIASYKNTSFSGTILEFILYKNILYVLFDLFVVLLSCCVSIALKNEKIGFLAVGILGLQMGKIYNPLGLLVLNEQYRCYRGIQVGGLVLQKVEWTTLGVIGLEVVLLFVLYRVMRKNVEV